MKKNIMIINADREAAQIVKNNLACPSTNILCVSSMHEALLSFMDKEFCLVILDACISAEDDHKLLKAMRKARTTPILILSSQSCHVERLKVLQAGAHAYIGHPYSLEECLAQAQALMQLYCDLKPRKEICYTLATLPGLVLIWLLVIGVWTIRLVMAFDCGLVVRTGASKVGRYIPAVLMSIVIVGVRLLANKYYEGILRILQL